VRARREAGFSLIELLTVAAVLAVVLLAAGQGMERLSRNYDAQRREIEAVDNARAALDTMLRLVRMAGSNTRNAGPLRAIDPDPLGDGAADAIALQSDWNPANGSLADPYENIVFFARDGALRKREAHDPPEGVVFADGVASLRFAYFDSRLERIESPSLRSGSIAYVEITLALRPGPGQEEVRIVSGASIRGRE
jgi:prepilin-type N-terminal cleavage/methylation domain-containing protein